ncbi:DUF3761 domain-containing protein [Roseateles saccharophilus]|uniref:Uncharacterized protein DUF3761 n=2 Tax=Roseateles saccharophilus TaxID=304 RepID=A0A4R3VJ37_ROSSA|nr:DUF3761 domain-containing protein [Roseateles saccharophilus]MDG0832441.1 DUF3761 domain-containing protein [Roseateles saccharophilus]TCV03902.1 uncharacterized protein DUF3761 [Roseateles saccharophilus]
MKALLISTLLAASMPLAALAAPPADAPAGTTGLCKDGSYYSGAKKGACRGHKGVKDWYGDAAAAAAAPAPAATPAAKPTAAAPAAAPAPAPTAAATPAKPDKRQPPQPAATAAPGGGPGLVWANEKTKVYHCEGDRWYGKTKEGEYMKEADAKAKGFKGPRGKDCKA